MNRGRDGDGKSLPEAERPSEQVQREFDTRDLDPDVGRHLDLLRINSRDLFLQATEQTRMAIVIVDPHADDQPIVYVNRAFVEMTGYARDEAVGRNCRFLQGEATDPGAVREIRNALASEEVAVVQLLNYRKNGDPFWNSLHIGPLYDEAGKLAYFYGSQWDVTNRVEAQLRAEAQQRAASELQHRVHNLFAVISAIVSISARGESDASKLSETIISRIQSLGRAHRASIGAGGTDKPETDMTDLVNAVLEPYGSSSESELRVEGAEIHLSARIVTPIGVALHELATNALKYGALGQKGGEVVVAWEAEGEMLRLDWRETRGLERAGQPTPTPGGGKGSRIVDGVLQSLGGSIEAGETDSGYHAVLRIPIETTD